MVVFTKQTDRFERETFFWHVYKVIERKQMHLCLCTFYTVAEVLWDKRARQPYIYCRKIHLYLCMACVTVSNRLFVCFSSWISNKSAGFVLLGQSFAILWIQNIFTIEIHCMYTTSVFLIVHSTHWLQSIAEFYCSRNSITCHLFLNKANRGGSSWPRYE